jgi:hypothetical protein
MRICLADALALGLATILLSFLVAPANAADTGFCGGKYRIGNKFWETKHPSVSAVLKHLPSSKRKTSGNIVSLNYARNSAGNLIHQTYFNDHWKRIFGTDTKSGYGRRLSGKWARSSNTSWGVATTPTRHNLSECVVDGTDTAICLGIPSGRINVSSLGHHTSWSMLDTASMPGSVGSYGCLVYDVMFSINFDFKGLPGKLPGFSNAPLGQASPNDHLCHGRERVKNNGQIFSTRVHFNDGGGSSKVATAKLGNNFKNDMFSYNCTADGKPEGNEFMLAMHAQDPKGDLQVIQRGVWYRIEHELGLNTNYISAQNNASGAFSRLWLYRQKDGVLLQKFTKKDTFLFDADRNGRMETYPLMPRTSSSKKISGIFMSVQQGGNLPGSGPWKLDHVIALRDLQLFIK